MDLALMEESLKTAPSPGAAAAIWWTTVLRDPKHDNGGDDRASMVSQMMADMLTQENPVEADALEIFAGFLKEDIDKQIEEGREEISIEVDYHPDRMLSDCAVRANLRVPEMGWPWKTRMWVTPKSVEVSYGYGAEVKIIWGQES